MGSCREVVDEALDGCSHLGLRPVVARAVAEAEVAGEPELVLVAAEVGPPVLRVLHHHALERLAQAGCDDPATADQPLALDRLEREQRLPEREGEARADLEDREVVTDHPAQGVLRLVVRGMRLVDERRLVRRSGRRAPRRHGRRTRRRPRHRTPRRAA